MLVFTLTEIFMFDLFNKLNKNLYTKYKCKNSSTIWSQKKWKAVIYFVFEFTRSQGIILEFI